MERSFFSLSLLSLLLLLFWSCRKHFLQNRRTATLSPIFYLDSIRLLVHSPTRLWKSNVYHGFEHLRLFRSRSIFIRIMSEGTNDTYLELSTMRNVLHILIKISIPYIFLVSIIGIGGNFLTIIMLLKKSISKNFNNCTLIALGKWIHSID